MGRSHCCNTASHNRSGSRSPAFAISISFCATTLLDNVAAINKPKRYQCHLIGNTHEPHCLGVESVTI